MKQKNLIDLYRKHIETVFRYLMNMCHHSELAEDLTQETFTRATIYFDKLRDESVRGWLLRTARNIYIDWWRKEHHNITYSLEDYNFKLADRLKQSIHPLPEEELLRKEQIQEVRKVLAKLPEIYRTALVLRDILGLSYDEIGKVTHWPAPKIKMIIYQARQRFRKLYITKDNNE